MRLKLYMNDLFNRYIVGVGGTNLPQEEIILFGNGVEP